MRPQGHREDSVQVVALARLVLPSGHVNMSGEAMDVAQTLRGTRAGATWPTLLLTHRSGPGQFFLKSDFLSPNKLTPRERQRLPLCHFKKDTERRLRSERSAGRCVCHSLSPVRPPSDVYRAGRRDREHKARSRVTQLPGVQRLANGRRPRLHLALCCRTDAAVATRRPCGGQRGPCGSSTQSR